MKRKDLLILLALAVLLLPIPLNAQDDAARSQKDEAVQARTDEQGPGIYAIVGDQSTAIPFTYGKAVVSGEYVMGVEVSYNSYVFNGETSGISAGCSFVLITDPQLKKPVKKMKEYNPFIKNMSPDKMLLVPLKVNTDEHRREFYQGSKWDTFKFNDCGGLNFDWKKLGKNHFEITAYSLPPGEYGFFFKSEVVMGYDYTVIFAFTIPSENKQ